MFIYLDESGDLGFDFQKKGTSKYFVITLLVCKNQETQDSFKKAVSRTLKNKLNHKKNNKRVVHELKGAKTNLAIKKYFISHLDLLGEWKIYSVTLNKSRVQSHLCTKAGKKKLYNHLANFIIQKVSFENEESVCLIVDRCKNKEEIKDFNSYMINQLEGFIPLNANLKIDHSLSEENPCLQAVDLFCWGIARKDALNEKDWFDCYKSKIAFSTLYFRQKKDGP